MSETQRPVLYSFRRCPFAMRARMALFTSGQTCELREVVLRDKPPEMIAASPKATVPVLIDTDGTVFEESLDIMHWALARNDPAGWLTPELGDHAEMDRLVARIDGPFKQHLDRYKYANRYIQENDGAGVDPVHHRGGALAILADLDDRLSRSDYLFGRRMSLADVAIAPFVRQFANTDADWFAAQPLPHLQTWLSSILASALFAGVMRKYPRWQSGTAGMDFPE
jgi:glutathione S-transferase